MEMKSKNCCTKRESISLWQRQTLLCIEMDELWKDTLISKESSGAHMADASSRALALGAYRHIYF